jgi:hypothetical protein
MTESITVEDITGLHGGLAEDLRAESRGAILRIVRAAGGCRMGFILFLVDDELGVLGIWRLGRQPVGLQGFPTAKALELALAAKAAGMIVVQERDDPIPRRPDLELTRSLRHALAETGVELLDHLLIAGDAVAACRPR